MEFNFADALKQIGPNVAAQMANAARPAGDYLFNTLLPERQVADYMVKSGTMTVRATMAGLVGMDAKYPPGGLTEISTFMEQAAKFAIEVALSEGQQRTLQQMMRDGWVAGGQAASTDLAVRTVLNFLDKLVIQPHLDLMEWLRGKALTTGAIDWSYNGINLNVSYGIPAAQLLTKRTSTAAWDSTASAFWTDIGLIYKYLGVWNPSLRIFVHPTTLAAILANAANKLIVVGQTEGSVRLQQYTGSTEIYRGDARQAVTLTVYPLEAEVYDYSTPGVGKTQKLPFMPEKTLLAVAPSGRLNQFIVGAGSTDNPLQQLELGYTHIAPTVEGGGVTGRWSRVYTPQERPMQLIGQGVTNGIPVIETPERIVVATSEIGGS